jgi:hypothetical protein
MLASCDRRRGELSGVLLAVAGPSLYVRNDRGYGERVSAVSTNPIRWWAACAFARNPLARTADRIQAWAVVGGLALLVAAAYPALAVGQLGYAVRSQDVAAEAAQRHPVEATALGDSTAAPAQVESTSTTFVAPVRWTAGNVAHDTTTKVDRPVKAGDRVRIWLDDQGKVTTPPLTEADARLDALATTALVWLTMAAIVVGALLVLRSMLGRARNRSWDKSLRELVDNGGGSTTRRP